jgi:uncharacterized membrane protein YhhN
MNFRIHSLLYFCSGIIFIALGTIGAEYPALLTKILIIPILIWLYLRFVRGEWNLFHRIIVSALVFSWIGDISLQLTFLLEDLFLVGLGSFLIAQLLYMIAFIATKGPSIQLREFYLVLPVALYGVLILWLLWEGLGDMTIPVTIYCTIILAMLAAAINRKGKVNPQSYQLVLFGAILFVLSDSMIAVNRFKQSFELASISIMTSYITAQYLIALGCLRQYKLTLKTNPEKPTLKNPTDEVS